MSETQFNPSDHTVDEVNAYLAEHPDESGAILTAEEDGQARKGILEGPHATPAEDTNAPQTVEQAGEAQTVPAGEKYEKGYEGFVPSRDGDNPVDLSLAGVTAHLNKDA